MLRLGLKSIKYHLVPSLQASLWRRSAWDLAAGGLIIREAGGIVSGLDGSENYLETGHVLAGTPKIYAALAKLCASDIKAVLH